MSIQSTVTISRQVAIDRITEITELVRQKNYRGVEQKTNEPDYDLENFVNTGIDSEISCQHWTNRMLEDMMDQPFYRFSMFDNYFVEDEANDD